MRLHFANTPSLQKKRTIYFALRSFFRIFAAEK